MKHQTCECSNLPDMRIILRMLHCDTASRYFFLFAVSFTRQESSCRDKNPFLLPLSTFLATLERQSSSIKLLNIHSHVYWPISLHIYIYIYTPYVNAKDQAVPYLQHRYLRVHILEGGHDLPTLGQAIGQPAHIISLLPSFMSMSTGRC